ncbi:MAG: hypothetical protein BGO90_00910 [Legionella sp. 40-6]|nr:MAG: hypothetical protein BGO90_00910 [Legionella sp. 40-6]
MKALIVFALFTQVVHANDCLECNEPRLGISGSIGATNFQQAYANDGQSILGRLSLNGQYELTESLNLGLEIGVQNGNTMRLNISKPVLDMLGGEPVTVTIKPLFDTLVTLKVKPFNSLDLLGLLKGGLAYRQLQVDRNEVNNLEKIDPELQTGLEYRVNENGSLFLTFQHVFGRNPNYQVNPLIETGYIEELPSQNSILIGLSVLL